MKLGARYYTEIKGEGFIVETRPQSMLPTEMKFVSCGCARFVRASTDRAIVIYHDLDCKELADGRA